MKEYTKLEIELLEMIMDMLLKVDALTNVSVVHKLAKLLRNDEQRRKENK